MAKQKTDTEDPGVALRIDEAPDLRPDGVPVQSPEVPPASSSGAKSGQTASTQKKG